MGGKISIIVPVYKVEAYLPKCIESIIHQTYRDLEIILVDDGSPDKCGEICDQYAAGDTRISVIHKEKNDGLAGARNTGMELATGEYIFFVDSDDWLAEDALEKLYDGLEKYQADCSVGVCVTILEDENGEMHTQYGKPRGIECKTAMEAMKEVLLTCSSAGNRLYKRKMLEGLRFPHGRINEDEPFVLRLYERMERIIFLDCDTYFYRKRKDSITTSDFSVKKVDCVYNSRENLEFVTIKAPELIPAAEYKYCKTLLWCYINLFKLKAQHAKTLRIQIHKEIRKHWKMALTNPYLGVHLKILTLVCLI